MNSTEGVTKQINLSNLLLNPMLRGRLYHSVKWVLLDDNTVHGYTNLMHAAAHASVLLNKLEQVPVMKIVLACRTKERFSRMYCDEGTQVGYILDLIPRGTFENMVESNCKLFSDVIDFDIELFDTINGNKVGL